MNSRIYPANSCSIANCIMFMNGLAFGWLVGSSWPVNVYNIELYISGLVVGELNNIRFFIF